MGVAFTQTQDKDNNYKNETTSKGEYHCFHCRKHDLWSPSWPEMEGEKRGNIHADVGTDREKEYRDGSTKEMYF